VEGGKRCWIRCAQEPSLVLEVCHGTDKLQLGAWEEGSEHQQWRRSGDYIQHVTTGLFLDAEVAYVYQTLGKPWEAGGALSVRPRDDSDRQSWVVDGEFIRHRMDGRVLDVNFWALEAGRGVNLNAPHTTCHGCSWAIEDVIDTEQGGTVQGGEGGTLMHVATYSSDEVVSQKYTWHKYCELAAEQGGRLPTVYELKAGMSHKEREWGECWVPVTLTGAEERDAKLRFSGRIDGKSGEDRENVWACLSDRRPYVMEYPKWGIDAEEGRPPSEAFFVAAGALEEHVPPEVLAEAVDVAPIADVPDGAEFYISVAAAPEYGLAIGKDAEDPAKVKLALLVEGNAKQKWTLEGDRFRNVASEEYLDSRTQYIFVNNADHPWCNNHSQLFTAPRSQSDSQRWVFGPEEFHGGKVLRHYMDGRGVDVHGWRFTDGGNMGVENSVHADCKGLSYVLRLCDGAFKK